MHRTFKLNQYQCLTCTSNRTNVIVFLNYLHPRKSVLNLNELGQMNGSAGGAAAGEDEEFPAQHELGEELKFTGRSERTTICVDYMSRFPVM